MRQTATIVTLERRAEAAEQFGNKTNDEYENLKKRIDAIITNGSENVQSQFDAMELRIKSMEELLAQLHGQHQHVPNATRAPQQPQRQPQTYGLEHTM